MLGPATSPHNTTWSTAPWLSLTSLPRLPPPHDARNRSEAIAAPAGEIRSARASPIRDPSSDLQGSDGGPARRLLTRRGTRARRGHGARWRGRVLPAHGSDAVGGDAAGAGHHTLRVRAPHRLLPWRPRPHPVQRRKAACPLLVLRLRCPGLRYLEACCWGWWGISLVLVLSPHVSI